MIQRREDLSPQVDRPQRRRDIAAGRLREIKSRLSDVCDRLPDRFEWLGMKLASELKWEPHRRAVRAEVRDSWESSTASITFPDDPDDPEILIDAACSCQDADPDAPKVMCDHALLVLQALHKQLQKRKSPLRDALLESFALEPWELVIRCLDHACALGSAAENGTGATTAESRLIWRVSFDISDFGVKVEPAQQRRGRGGNWSRGRKLRWSELLRGNPPWADEQDRELLAAIRGDRLPAAHEYYRWELNLDQLSILERLAGHPRVVREGRKQTPLTIERVELTLRIVEEDDGALALKVCAGGEAVLGEYEAIRNRSHFACWRRDADRILVAKISRQQAAVLADPRVWRTLFPPDARDELFRRLPTLAQWLPIEVPDNYRTRGEADRRLHVCLSALDSSGLGVELRFRPLASGKHLPPGDGAERIGGWIDASWVDVWRDLDEEARCAHAFEESCLRAFANPRGRWKWVVENDDDALDLVAELQRLAEGSAEAEKDNHRDGIVVAWAEDGDERRVHNGSASPKELRVRVDAQRDWFGLAGGIDIDGETVELTALFESLRKGRRYVPLSGNRWLRITRALQERLNSLLDLAHLDDKGLRVGKAAAPAVEEVLANDVTVELCEAWQKLLSRFHEVRAEEPEVPAALKADLRDYQLEGFRWLSRLSRWGVGGCLADDMGLGKTVQTIAVLLERASAGPALVVAPTSVGANWERELKRFAPGVRRKAGLRARIYRDAGDRDALIAELAHGDVLIVSYGLLRIDCERLASRTWGTLVLDEAQFIKNSQTRTARAACQIRAGWRLALTGTPIENHVGELWSLFHAISPGLFGEWRTFRARFAEPIERYHDDARRQALSRVVRPFVLRRTKGEVLEELPERTEVELSVTLSPVERRLYEETRLSALAKFASQKGSAGESQRMEILAALMRLRQLACHPRLLHAETEIGSSKMRLLVETVRTLRGEGHRALVFSQFTKHLALVREELDRAGITYEYLDGATPARQRKVRIDRFQEGSGDVFLISLKAGGTGLNLTAANYVVHLDPWWNPAVEDQATDRAHRIGQTRRVTVYRLVTKDTIEEEILALHASKRDLVAGVLDGTGAAAKLSADELVALISRGGAAAGSADEEPDEEEPAAATRAIAKAATRATAKAAKRTKKPTSPRTKNRR